MHVVLANSALDLPAPGRWVDVLRLARRGARLLGMAAQSLAFFAVLWLLAAGPGFLSARDNLVSGGMDRPTTQASR